MLIKDIRLADEVTDPEDGNIDVFIESQDGYVFTVVVTTAKNILKNMKENQSNFLEPSYMLIPVKKLTEEIITEAIKAYAKDDGYWLKLYQFANAIDISVFDKLQAQHIEFQKELDNS